MKDASSHHLYRSEHDRMLAGVCGGLAEYFEVDATLLRLLFVLLTVAGGAGVLLYLLCWLIIPTQSAPPESTRETLHKNAEQVAEEIKEEWSKIESSHYHYAARPHAGFWLIVLGVVFLLVNVGLFSFALLAKLWPLVLIVIGVQVLIRRR